MHSLQNGPTIATTNWSKTNIKKLNKNLAHPIKDRNIKTKTLEAMKTDSRIIKQMKKLKKVKDQTDSYTNLQINKKRVHKVVVVQTLKISLIVTCTSPKKKCIFKFKM